MPLYTISLVLMLLSFMVAGYRKRDQDFIIRLPLYISAAAVLALPTMLPLVIFLVCFFNLELKE